MKISKEKQTHLILVALGTAGVIAGLWFGLIQMEQSKIHEIARKSQSVQDDIAKIQKVIVEANEVSESLKEATNKLSAIETAMPSGDLFSWIVSSIKQFNAPSYKVDMPQIGAPSVDQVRMFSDFPYKQATVSVSGSAYYYEFGKFLADLENHFPYTRVQNLSLEPGFGTTPEDHEKLTFRMEIVTLIKTNSI